MFRFAGLLTVAAFALIATLSAIQSKDAPAATLRGAAIPRAALYAQVCAGCHGATLRGGTATSLVDDEWKHGSDDASIAKVIAEGVSGTQMAPFNTLLDEQQIRELVYYIREQAAAAKGRPELKVDPHGQVVKTQRQTVTLEVIARGLETPWALAFLPDGRLLITERPGRLRILENGKLLPPVSGIPQVWTVQDGGLFDVEVHPDYVRNGWLYLSYSEVLSTGSGQAASTGSGEAPEKASMTRIVRGRIRKNAWVDQQDIYKAPPELFYVANSHYGSRFIFDRQGHLFYSIGDRGRVEDAQDLSKPIGKIHRINDDGSIPRDNPFVGRPDVVQSIWSYGHRNPQGFAFHPVSGKLWATEHGPTGGDELNVIERGGNYGWAVVSNGLQPGITKSVQEGMQPPVVHWSPSIAPSGIAFYNGTRYPRWRDHLFLSALAGQHLRRLEVSGDKVVHQEVLFSEFGRVRDIVVGPDGCFYAALNLPGQRLHDTTAGVVIRLNPVDPPKN